MFMGLPTPNTTRFPSSRRASFQICALLPLPLQNQLRIGGSKVTRIAAFGTKFLQILLILVAICCLWMLFLVGSPNSRKSSGENVVDYVASSTETYEIADSHKPFTMTSSVSQENADTVPDRLGLAIPMDLGNVRLPDRFEDSQDSERTTVEDEVDFEEDLPDPRPVRAKSHQRYLTLATMIKNQRRWLREWLEFNLMNGIEHFIIYDNESTDLPLEILQPYIDRGLITYIPWPPKTIPPPKKFRTKLERWQYRWLRDALETCLDHGWVLHRQGPCQLAAFMDAVQRTKNGVSRWLAIWDIDEFIFPKERSNFRTLAELLRRRFSDADHIKIWGNVFGTSGHIEHAAERKPGSRLPALVTEEYTYRGVLNRSIPINSS